MSINFENYFHENIIEKFKEYKKTLKSRKKGLNKDLRVTLEMASLLFHLREHLPGDLKKALSYYIDMCPDYEVISNIANVSKHKEINRNKPKLTKLENIYEVEVITEFEDSSGPYYCSEKIIEISCIDGTTRNVNEIIINVLNMWINELEILNTVSNLGSVKNPPFKIPKRGTRLENMDLVAKKGLEFSYKIKLQKYNYENSTMQPRDLNGGKLTFEIYEIKYDLKLQAIHPISQEIHEFTIKVNEQEKKNFEKMVDDIEKMHYFITLAKREGINLTYFPTSSPTPQ